eukprot:scaffold7029_cov375-Pinguiococcus_pyrenoidosus.AAC.9
MENKSQRRSTLSPSASSPAQKKKEKCALDKSEGGGEGEDKDYLKAAGKQRKLARPADCMAAAVPPRPPLRTRERAAICSSRRWP